MNGLEQNFGFLPNVGFLDISTKLSNNLRRDSDPDIGRGSLHLPKTSCREISEDDRARNSSRFEF